VKHIHDKERFAIEQNHMAPDQDVLTVGWRRWKAVFHILGAPQHFLSQSGRQSSAHDKLALQARWEPVALR
jgi:hypothetical protein